MTRTHPPPRTAGRFPATSIPTTTPRTTATPRSCTTCSRTRSCPTFYERDEAGLPQRWLEMIRASLRTLGPVFSATRMLAQYVDGPYRG